MAGNRKIIIIFTAFLNFFGSFMKLRVCYRASFFIVLAGMICCGVGCIKKTATNLHIALSSMDWHELTPYFVPPDSFKNVYGSYRSPLVFYNGDTVKTPEEWTLRHQEIRDTWMQMMGEWPPLITDSRFEYLDSVQNDGYVAYTVSFEWLPSRKTVGYLLKPDREGTKPAVITVFYEPETAVGIGGSPQRDFARQLALRGIVTLSIGTSDIIVDTTFMQFYPDYVRHPIEPLSLLAYASVNAWYALSKEADVDATRIGIVGHSYGGKWAMLASCLFDGFACAAWSDPGIVFDESCPDVNYWEPYYFGYHAPPWRKRGIISEDNPAQGLYVRLRTKGYDLHELHALMAPRPFLVSGGSEDTEKRWIPLNHSIVVNQLLGYHERVAMSNRKDHAPDETSNEIIYAFFSYFLNSRK